MHVVTNTTQLTDLLRTCVAIEQKRQRENPTEHATQGDRDYALYEEVCQLPEWRNIMLQCPTNR